MSSNDTAADTYIQEERKDSFEILPARPPKFIVHTDMAYAQLFPSKDVDDYRRHHPEFTTLDYTAILEVSRDDSDEVVYKRQEIEQFPINHQLKAASRQIKIALVVTMYNEDIDLFIKTMAAVQRNIDYLCVTERWGREGWKNFVVVIVSDGAKLINPRVKLGLEVMGLFDESLALPSRDGFPVAAHLFQRSTNISINSSLEVDYKATPMQTIFLLKQENAKKINSHRWFFSAICKKLNPEVCFLLDVGTKPTVTSFYHLYECFQKFPNCGGCAGEIYVEAGKKLLNPLVAAQNFEYKMSNILDKPLESVFGYISVLPGAFSAYRWEAIQGRPLEQYFHGEFPTNDIKSANLYLAEDRILCFEVVAKQGCNWNLKYVKDAKAETDCPDNLPELISQRRRWLNGSFFCSLHSVANFKQFFKTNHNTKQLLLFTIQTFYNCVNILLVWFAVANFYITFYSLFDTSRELDRANNQNLQNIDPFFPIGGVVLGVFQVLYFVALLGCIVASMGNRPKGTKMLYIGIAIFFGILMLLMLFMGFWAIARALNNFDNRFIFRSMFTSPEFRDLVLGLATTYFAYFASSMIYLDPWHIFTSQAQYLLLFPTYINVFMVYSFCNLHDISWGTKGATSGKEAKNVVAVMSEEKERELHYQYGEDLRSIQFAKSCIALKEGTEPPPKKRSIKEKQEDYERLFRTKVVIWWIFSNLVLMFTFTQKDFLIRIFPSNSSLNPYLTFLFWTVAFMSIVRFVGSVIYIIHYRKANTTIQPSLIV